MNIESSISVFVLACIAGVVGVLLLSGKVKLVIVRRTKEEPEPVTAQVALDAAPEKKKQRSRTASKKSKARHLYLPPGMTTLQLENLGDFLSKYENKAGDKVILHAPSNNGPEREIEVPYPVLWDKQLKESLTTILGGWA